MVTSPKRTARRKSNVQYNDQELSELSDDGVDSDTSPPPRKRARGKAGAGVSKAKKKGKAKQTSMLLEMPLDVMFEILSCVEPKDLLQLSRASKALRRVIMDKSNKFIWGNSFTADEDAPKCPTDISEPAWAQLLYSPYCQHCHSSRSTEIYWASYRRLCKKCLSVLVTSHTKAFEDAVEIGLRSAFQEAGFTSFSKVLPGVKLRAGKQAMWNYFTDHLREFLEAALEWYNSHDRANIGPFLKEYAERLKVRAQHADRCLAWERRQRNHRQEEKEEERTKRHDEVVARLEALGFGDELKKHKDWYYEGMQNLPPMSSSKPVTDKVWSTCKDRIIKFVKDQQSKRLNAERSKVIKSRYQEVDKIVTTYQRTHHPHEFYISTLDVCRSPGVSEMIVGPSDEAFQECLARIPDVIPETHALALEKRQSEILTLLPEGSKEEDLALAVTWFKCRSCGRSFHHEEAIKHSCYPFRSWSYRTHEEIRGLEPLEQVYQLCGRGTWIVDRFIYYNDVAELTKQVIEAMEMDPKKATVDELDDAKHRFIVFSGTGTSTVTVVGWRCLVTGRYEKPSCKRVIPEWRIMKPVEMPEFKHPSVRLDKDEWACLHCWKNMAPQSDISWASLKTHLKEKHNVDKPTEADYYCTKPAFQNDFYLREAAVM